MKRILFVVIVVILCAVIFRDYSHAGPRSICCLPSKYFQNKDIQKAIDEIKLGLYTHYYNIGIDLSKSKLKTTRRINFTLDTPHYVIFRGALAKPLEKNGRVRLFTVSFKLKDTKLGLFPDMLKMRYACYNSGIEEITFEHFGFEGAFIIPPEDMVSMITEIGDSLK